MTSKDIKLIKEMLQMQAKLDEAIMKEYGLTCIDEEKLRFAIIDEVGELTHELKGNWCWWKKSQEPVNRNKALEELVDVFHFVLIYELFYGKRTYLLDDLGYDLESPRDYMPMVQMDIGLGIATALTHIIDLADSRLMYLLALSEHLGFCLETVYAAYMRKNAINMERLKNGY